MKSKIGTAIIIIQSILIGLLLIYSFVQQGIAKENANLAYQKAQEAQRVADVANRIRAELEECQQSLKK